MGITGMGIMRGALPVATEYLQDTPNINRQIISAIGEKYSSLAPEAEKLISNAKNNIAIIDDIANTYGVPSDIVSGLYSATGGKRKETITQLKNLLDTYGSADLIPVENLPVSQDTPTDEQEINIAPIIDDDETIFKTIASLFKRLGPEEAIAAFAREKNISEDQVKDFISGNVGKYIPEYDAKTKLTSEAALSALQAPKAEEQPLVSGGLNLAFYQQLVAKQKDAMDNPGKYKENHEKLLFGFPAQFLKALESDSSTDLIMRKNIASMFTQIRPIGKTGEIPPKYKGIIESADKIIETGIGDPKVIYDPSLMNSLILARGAEDIDFDEVGSLVQQILSTKKIPEGPLSTDDIYFDSLVAQIIRANPTITIPEARERAAAFIKINPTYDGLGGAWNKILLPGGGVGVQQLSMFDVGGSETIPTKLKNEIKGQIAILGDAFDSIGSLKQLLKEDDNSVVGGNNTFATFFTAIRMRGGDVLSMFGQQEMAKKLMGDKLQNALQQRISFVKRTKEEIFDDPRLSDKDLAIIIDYIGILYDPTISDTRALAALLGIEKALTNGYVRNIKDLYPNLPTAIMDNNKVNFNETSVAKAVLDNLLMANNIMTIDEFKHSQRNVTAEEAKINNIKYGALTKPYRNLVANGIKRLIYFEDVTGKLNEQKYTEEFITDFGDILPSAVAGKTMEAVYSESQKEGFDAKRVLNSILRKRRNI